MIAKLELKRQIVHLFLGITIVALVYFDLINYIILGAASAVFIALSYLEKKGHKIFLFDNFLDFLERKSEKKGIRAKGAIFYLIGATLALLFFPKDVAMASIIILAVGDSVSRVVGPYGYLKHPFNSKKFIEGVIVGTILSTLAAMIFVPFVYALCASAASMFLESLDIEVNEFKVDDNLTIPLVSGCVMLVLGKFLF